MHKPFDPAVPLQEIYPTERCTVYTNSCVQGLVGGWLPEERDRRMNTVPAHLPEVPKGGKSRNRKQKGREADWGLVLSGGAVLSGKMKKLWRWVVGTASQQHECT